MLFFHRFEDIRDYKMAVRYKDVDLRPFPYNVYGFPQVVMIDEISEDLWDYHLDFKRWWQDTKKRAVDPVKIKVSKIIFRQLQREYTPDVRTDAGTPYINQIVFLPDGTPVLPPGTVYYFGTPDIQIMNEPFVGAGQLPVTPPAGQFTSYYQVLWGVAPQKQQDLFFRYGYFFRTSNVFNMPGVPGTFTLNVLRDELITDYKLARLNYLTPVDAGVLRKGDSGAGNPGDPDPQPITKPSWKGVWTATTKYEPQDIVSRGIFTFFCIREAKGFDPLAAPLFWERCNRPKTQIVCGSARSLTAEIGISPIYFFPSREDIMPLCKRIYPSSTPIQEHDWRGGDDSTLPFPHVDTFGLAVYAPEAAGYDYSHTFGLLPPNAPFEINLEDRDNGPNVPIEEYGNEATIGTDGQSYNFYEKYRNYHITEIIRVSVTAPF